jgi:LysM repeat protein
VLLVSLAAKTALAATMSLSGHGYVTVAPGDTLGTIAAATGTTWQAVYAANRAAVSDPNVIYAGEHLVMPGGGATIQTTAKVTAQAAGDGDNDGDDNGQAAPEATAPNGAATAATAPAPAQQLASSSSGSASGGSGTIPSSFFSCVHLRESTNGQASSNQFGIMPSTWSAYGFPGSPYTASYSEQVKAFQTIYAAVGTSAWAPYDGC